MGLLEKYMRLKGYVEYYRIHRELERMMGVVEFHFLNAKKEKKEALTFRSYNKMIETLTKLIDECEKRSKDD